MKVCTKCKRELTVDNFTKNKGRKDGLCDRCKGCYKQYYQDNKMAIAKILDAMIGKKFGKLSVIEFMGNSKHGHKRYKCLCDCGKETIKAGVLLRNKETQSCGCNLKEYYDSHTVITHGQSYTKLYHVWAAMKSRCKNPNDNNYKNYGDRGIDFCDDWAIYENFYLWAMNAGYAKDLEIDRKNNDGNYEPLNCRWATRKEQCNNTRRTKHKFEEVIKDVS